MNEDFDLFRMSEDPEELRWAVRNVAEDKIAPDAAAVDADASFPQANTLSPLLRSAGRDLFAYDKQRVGGLTLTPRTPSPKSAARAPGRRDRPGQGNRVWGSNACGSSHRSSRTTRMARRGMTPRPQ